MKLYTYYSDVPSLPRVDEISLTIQWRAAWKAAGFEPHVLSEYDAMKHPYYQAFKEKISALPSCNPDKYEVACFMRWLALAQVGGGWMADYDVFPNQRKPLWGIGGNIQSSVIRIYQAPCCPCLVHCSAENALQLCAIFASGKYGNRPQDGKPHFSDQYVLDDLLSDKMEDPHPALEVTNFVTHYSQPGWRTAPAIHFPNAVMQPAGKMPKWKHVPEILGTLTTPPHEL